MIYEGLCDTEDWSNDAENTAAHHRNKLHIEQIFTYKIVLLNCNNISQFDCIVDWINAAQVSRMNQNSAYLW